MSFPTDSARHDRRFDPFAESTVDGIVAGSVTIKVISGQLLTDKKVGTYVEVEMYGLPADTVRKKFRTKVVPANGINPTYGEEPFVFKKVVLPNLATLRIVVCEENGRLLGQRVLPVEGLRPGYRHICLRNELNQPQNLATLFVHVKVGDYVPDAFADFAAALANPIAYQSALEKHAQQLAVLEEEAEEDRQYGAGEEMFEETDGTITRQDRNCTRTNSVLSKHSSSGETPGGSSGGGTPTHLCKQDSVGGSRSQNASGGVTRGSSRRGASSHSSPLCEQSARGATVPAVSENGAGATGSNQFSALAATKLSVGVSSLPSSPLHSASGRPNLMENGAPHPSHVPPQPKVDVSQTSRLKDPELLEPVTLEQLKETKPVQKLLLKQDKEVDGLRRKLEKAQQILREVHGLQEEKLLLSQIKGKGTLQKAYRKSVKRASRRGNSNPADGPNLQDALTPDQLRKHWEQKVSQAEEMMALCREHYKTESDVAGHYVLLLNNALCHAIDVRQEALLKQLDDIHDREVTELRKKLDTYNHDEMKALAKKHKEKNELSRIKREAMKKHITLAVQERQKLQDLLDRRKADVVEMFDALRQRAAEDKVKAAETVTRACEARCTRLEQEHREIFSTPVSESTSIASAHCQTPGVAGGNGRSTPEVTKM
ncbi:hypothetical protein NP493_2104g00001 [Ridgeia piscesae]|uniref:phosphoinositide phospholipase C n=1 Tax=Ridgeia piscesae TaxID=27915 RepID=A0AAD9JLW2_RIDPI|nr:hypothetical protein NP493_2104g00001 [Ridgeia piscesae]